MNANKMLCKSRFSISDANALYKDADMKCPYDAYVSFQRCNFHDADVLCRDENMKFIHDGASAHIQITMQVSHCKDGDVKCLVVQMPSNGYVMMQMLPCGYVMMPTQLIQKKFLLFSKRGLLNA